MTGGRTEGVAEPKLPFETDRGGECLVGERPVAEDGNAEA